MHRTEKSALIKKPEIRLPRPLYPGVLIKRYKRFLADVKMPDGTVVTAHCPNSGSMKTCCCSGNPVMLSKSNNPRRRTQWTWELIQMGKTWVGVNTLLPNRLVAAAIQGKLLPEFSSWALVRREPSFGKHSRLDLLLNNGAMLCYIEIKNVTMVENNSAFFPDAVTARGTKHLQHLIQTVREGNKACIFYVIQRSDVRTLRPADMIDPLYGETLRNASNAGVWVVAYKAKVTPHAVTLVASIPVDLS